MRVLLVESHADTRDLYAECLKLAGFEVLCASCTDEATSLLRRVDAVVTGINVNGRIGGLDLVRIIRSNAATATLAVIVLSASAYPSDVARATAAGCDRFLSKPCLPGDLAAQIRETVLAGRPRTVRAMDRRSLPRRRSA
jgi:DNA-binding response OmpR family regulator